MDFSTTSSCRRSWKSAVKWLVQAPGTAARNYLHWASDLQKARLQPPLKRLPDPRPRAPAPGNLDFSKLSLTCWQHCLQCRETLGWSQCGLCLFPGSWGAGREAAWSLLGA